MRRLQSWKPIDIDPALEFIEAWDDQDPQAPKECVAAYRNGTLIDEPILIYREVLAKFGIAT